MYTSVHNNEEVHTYTMGVLYIPRIWFGPAAMTIAAAMSIALPNASFLATHSHGFLRQHVVCRLERCYHPSASSGESIERSAGSNHSHKRRRRMFYPFCLGRNGWRGIVQAQCALFSS